MKILKNKNFKFLLIGIIIVLIFFLCAIDSKGQEQLFDPISYDFENNVLYDKDGSFEPDMYNIREQSEYIGNYESRYSFEKYKEGIESTDIDFITFDFSEINAIPFIKDNWYGHSKVVMVNKTETTLSDFHYVNTFENRVIGNVSFWYISNNTYTPRLEIYLTHDSYSLEIPNIVIWIRCEVDKIKLSFGNGEGGITTIHYLDYYPNVWYYFEISMNCLTDKFSLYINKELIIDNKNYYNDQKFVYFNTLQFLTIDEDIYFVINAIDSVDYSWIESYIPNRNLIPKNEYTNQYEVDKYEFDYNSARFESDLTSWKQNEYNEITNDIQVKVSGAQSINKYMSINAPAYINSYKNGIQFNDNSSSYIINVSLSMEFYFKDVFCAHFIYIFTQNINLDYPIAMRFNGATDSVDIYNITSLSYDGFSTFTDQVIYEINFYLNYYDNVMIITLNSTEGFVKRISRIATDDRWLDLYGLDYIQVNNSISSEGDFGLINLFNVGIYEKGKYFQSILDNEEFGLMIYEIDDTWNSLIHNLITLNSENDYKLYASEVYVKFDEGYQLRSRSIQFEREIINIQNYGKLVFSYPLPCLVFMVFDNFSIPYEIEIEGISLIDNNGISTNARYIYDNTYPNRYFFYCIDNKLYYNFSNSYKLGIETMTIVFDVKDVLLDDSFLFAYESYISDDYDGSITLESYGFYESFSIPNDVKLINSVYNVSLEQQFTLTEIRIHIKTDTFDFASGYTSGYIQNLNLYYDIPLTPDYDPISVLELDFLEAMIFIVIRLIFFLIPSLIFRTKFGNKSILPMWLLIGLILFISGLIPFWLFFIQIIAIGSMLMLNRSKEVD